MSSSLRVPTRLLRHLRLSSLRCLGAAFAVVLLLGNAGCEDKAIGRPCEAQIDVDAGSPQAATINRPALECPTRLCIKPAREFGVNTVPDTAPYCTAECSKDSDCDDGERRGGGNPNDRRCIKNFVCGVATETGPFKCRKVCLCSDFLPETGLVTPPICMNQPAP